MVRVKYVNIVKHGSGLGSRLHLWLGLGLATGETSVIFA